MIVESRGRLFVQSIDHESCCIVDEPSELFTGRSMPHGYPRTGPRQCCPVTVFEIENRV